MGMADGGMGAGAGARASRLRGERLARRAEALLDAAAGEMARRCALAGARVEAGGFSFADYPTLAAGLEELLRGLHGGLLRAVEAGVRREWAAADAEADGLARRWAAGRGRPPAGAELRAWFGRNGAALEAFLARREGGLGLSGRVWRVAEGLGAELEGAVGLALLEGTPAEALGRAVRGYLREPSRLYRRVRGADGELRLSRAARAYRPGAGVYRSSYMNARRLAVTETSMAYRAADFERWSRMDFVVGVEVRLSNGHGCRGVPAGAYRDVCDELAGLYPREFRFVGWHPHCRCYAAPVVRGEGREARGLPGCFTAWAARSAERIARGAARGRLPLFIRDNFTVGEGGALMPVREGLGGGAP